MSSLVIARPPQAAEAISAHRSPRASEYVGARDDIEVRLDGKATGSVGKEWIQQVVAKTLRLEKISRAGVSVLVTGNRQIKALNKKYLNHDYATDVIAFGTGAEYAPHLGDPTTCLQRLPAAIGRQRRPNRWWGDVVVSAPMARLVSRRLGIPYKEELARYLVHGILHLLGYRDKRRKDRQRMHHRQEEILLSLRGGTK